MGPGTGYKRKSFIATLYKRHSRRFKKTSFGRFLVNIQDWVANTWIATLIVSYYESLYSGTILQTINIVNLMTVPLLNYFIKKNMETGIYYIVVSQII